MQPKNGNREAKKMENEKMWCIFHSPFRLAKSRPAGGCSLDAHCGGCLNFQLLDGIQLNLAVLSGQVSAHQRLITGDDGVCQRIFDLLCDQAAQIAGAVLD